MAGNEPIVFPDNGLTLGDQRMENLIRGDSDGGPGIWWNSYVEAKRIVLAPTR